MSGAEKFGPLGHLDDAVVIALAKRASGATLLAAIQELGFRIDRRTKGKEELKELCRRHLGKLPDEYRFVIGGDIPGHVAPAGHSPTLGDMALERAKGGSA